MTEAAWVSPKDLSIWFKSIAYSVPWQFISLMRSQVSILPPLASVLVTSIAAQFADNLIATGVETTMVRKEAVHSCVSQCFL